jgi:hypothetical protein
MSSLSSSTLPVCFDALLMFYTRTNVAFRAVALFL